MKISGNVLWLAKLVLGVAVIAWLISRTDAKSLWLTLRSVDFLWLIPVIVIPHLAIMLSSMKWYALLYARGARVTQIALFRLYMIGTFFSSFLPSMVGGDVVRIYQLTRTGCDSSVVVASIFLERFIGLVALVTLLPLAALQPQVADLAPDRWHFVNLAVIAIVVIAVLMFFGRIDVTAEQPTIGIKPVARLRRVLLRSREQVRSYRGHSGVLLYGYFLSVIFYMSAGLTVWCATQAVGGTPSMWTIVSVTPLVLMLGLIPVSVNGLGLLEAGYTWLLTSLGMPLHEALAVALILRCRSLITAGIGGMIFVVDRRAAPRAAAAIHQT